jgi:hypothetical protein
VIDGREHGTVHETELVVVPLVGREQPAQVVVLEEEEVLYVDERADQLSATGTPLAVLADRGESFSSIASAPGNVKMCATDLGRALQRYEYSRPALAALKIADRDDDVEIAVDMELAYCEGYVAVHSRPRRRRWVALDEYVLDVADEPLSMTEKEERHHRRAWIEPPSSAQYFGVAFPADRALSLYAEYSKQPLAPYAEWE